MDTGGAGGSTGGAGGSTGGSGGSTGGAGGSTGGSGGSTGGAGGGGAGGSTGMLSITVDGVPDPAKMRLCFKPEATNSGGNHSPKIDWTGVPAEAKSLVLTTEDLTGTPVCHQIICNIPPTVTGNPADAKSMIPAGAEASYGHAGKTAWYGPGAGAPLRRYEIKIWALATPMFEGGCGGPATSSRMHCTRLKAMATDKTKVLATASQILWGEADGKGCP
jgi:Raf kinase inhibitor-like YbhB/YbcL family protein